MIGRLGGLLCVWDPTVFSLLSLHKDPSSMQVTGFIKGCSVHVNVLNIHARQKPVEKGDLWNRILSQRDAVYGLWVLIGDFNVVRTVKERKNSKFKPNCARDFNSFIYNAELCEYDLKGSKVTYIVDGERGKKFSKIDKIVVCKEFQNKFFSSWLNRQDFQNIVVTALESFSRDGPPDVILIQKLKWIRGALKSWRDDIRTKEGEDELKAREELEELEHVMEDGDLSDEEEWVRLECQKKLRFLEDCKAKDLRQRARIKWAMEGDDNTAFFHGMVNNRKTSNAIQGLFINDVWINSPNKVKKAVFDYFRTIFKEDMVERPAVFEGGD
ncbi:uncharacterized protein LOC110888265 [Helianthus annuus]|uniref:uncharacterized protein LOC110888265 n=1 Tax=Helianthus annuus TaxID=4232 RepID=UPI000B903180|nr:uncharacterized protein LOC110888265 [Helianthus annuus]